MLIHMVERTSRSHFSVPSGCKTPNTALIGDRIVSSSAGAITLAEDQAEILASLRRLKGRGTVGDVVADSGLPNQSVRTGLKVLLESHRGHLDVSASGELLYDFDPKLIKRGSEPLLSRVKRTGARLLTAGFKVWIVIMLVGYFILFVVLVIAALVASQRGNNSRGGVGRRSHGGRIHTPNLWFWYWVWGPRWHIGRPYYGRRWERTLDKDDRVPFYKKVFAFVFGPDKPHPTQAQLDRSTIRLIKSKRGVLTTGELVEHTGLPRSDAAGEMGRILGTYDGEAIASPEGELVYVFPDVMTSAHKRKKVRSPSPAWLRLEYPFELTGNTAGANVAVAGMNLFTLIAAASSPWFIFPRLGIEGPAAFIGLVVVPVVFSVLFFGVPTLRMVRVKLENRRRAARNIRRVLLGFVYSKALEGDNAIGVDESYQHVSSRLKNQAIQRASVETALHTIATELNADVSTNESGALQFSFPTLRNEFLASETVRRKLRLDEQHVDKIVFSTSESPKEQGQRDLKLFDERLKEGSIDFRRHVPSVDQVSFEHEYELVAFDEELRQRGLASV